MTPTRIFLHYLSRLEKLLVQLECFSPNIAGERLHPDMAPLAQQAQQARTAIGFALRASCPLAGRDIVSFRDAATPLEELRLTMRYLAAIPDQAFADMAGLTIHTSAGCADLALPGLEFLQLYALPNFFFHYSMVYAIARQAGMPIGKADFDGYHAYPPGFKFP